MAVGSISSWTAFLAGLLSFLSPCVLPLLPVYLTYLAGTSVAATETESRRRSRLIINSLLFTLGFSLIFVLLGLSASALGSLLIEYQTLLQRVSGGLVVFLGLHLAGFLRIPFLERGGGVNVTAAGATPAASFVLGMAVSLGWTPCVGPILGSILLLAASQASLASGAYLLGLYSVGLAVPFLLTAFFLGAIVLRVRNLAKWAVKARIVVGIMMVVVGLLVAGGLLPRIDAWLSF